MTQPEYPPLAVLVFQDLDGSRVVKDRDLPPGIDANTYAWIREVVRRMRENRELIHQMKIIMRGA